MPVYRVEIFKEIGAEQWLNRYHIVSASLTTAIGAADELRATEREFHSNQVLFSGTRISDPSISNSEHVFLPGVTYGLVPGSTTAGLLPLWNVVKVLFSKGYNRPDYKLYRGVLGEANSEGGVLITGLQDSIYASISDYMTTFPNVLASEEGVPYIGIAVTPLIRQRDLHRRRRRTSTTPLVTP